jgi:dTDP-4-dehydrorhamnose reductase
MRALITGAGGMLGRACADALRARGHEVEALTHSELDITEAGAVTGALEHGGPDVVVNCAAWTDVDGAEDDERGAMRVNDEAAGMLAAAAASVDASILHPSSDYVFDGTKREPYVESDHPAPLSAYGRSKLGGETSVAVANPRHLIVRSSWLYGVGGPNFVETMLRIGSEQQEVLVVSDQVGTPTYARHLAGGIAELVEAGQSGIHHVAAAGPCSWYEFATEIFDQAGIECRVMSATTEMLARKAPRPAYSALASERRVAPALPHWRQGLGSYLVERVSEAPESDADELGGAA